MALPSFFVVFLSAIFVVVVHSSIIRDHSIIASKERREQKKLEIVNHSGRTIVVEWIHPQTGTTTTLHKGVIDGQSTVFNSFVNHTFALHEPSEECGTASNSTESCKVRYITVNERDQQGPCST
jgi:hypothetical protein